MKTAEQRITIQQHGDCNGTLAVDGLAVTFGTATVQCVALHIVRCGTIL